jgi:hypothetical protein
VIQYEDKYYSMDQASSLVESGVRIYRSKLAAPI